jgi:thioesterase domain-containing protein
VPIQPEGARAPLFLVHPASGQVLPFFALAGHLGAGQPLYGLQARGLAEDETPFATVEAMAAYYVALIRRVQPHGPYQIGGYSLGGWIAYEMARQIAATGGAIAGVHIVDTHPPRAGDLTPPDEAGLLAFLVGQFGEYFGRSVAVSAADLAGLAPAVQLERAFAALAKAGLVPPGHDLGWFARIFAVYRAGMAASLAFSPMPADLPLHVYPTADLMAEFPADPTLGWGALTAQPVGVRPIPGVHATVVSAPHVAALAEALRAGLAAATVEAAP